MSLTDKLTPIPCAVCSATHPMSESCDPERLWNECADLREKLREAKASALTFEDEADRLGKELAEARAEIARLKEAGARNRL